MLLHREIDLYEDMRIVIPYAEPPENVLTHSSAEGLKIVNAVYVSFEILSPRKSFTVVCESLKERDEWVQAIMEAINNNRSLHKARHGEVAAMWTPDNLVDACELCHKAFTMITRRRHHCRACGKVACHDCCHQFYSIPYIKKNKKVRICNDCYEEKLSDQTST